MKEELIMHILYFGCLATDLLDFIINTLLCIAMVTMLVKDIPQRYRYVQLIVIRYR